jgi:hypothetical protein
VLVDGVPKAYTISGGGSQWSLGKNLVVPISPAHVPDRVQIIYNGTSMGGGSVGSGVVLREASSTNIVNSANISADIAPYLDCSAVRNWACADQIPPEIIVAEFMKNSSVKKINFMQLNQNRGAIVGGAGYHLNFTVSKDNSSIILGNDQCTSTTNFVLKANDRVNVTFDVAPDRFTVYGMAPQIWMMVGGGPSRITTTITNISGTYVYTNVLNARAICGAWIQGYSELDSTINIQTINTGEMTSLIVNDTIYVQSPSATSFTFTNVQPIGNGMFLVTYTSNQAPLYMIGWADTVKFNGVTQTGLGL